MRGRLVILPLARRDLLDAVQWYDERSLTAGDRMLQEVNQGLEMIVAAPERHNFSPLGERCYRLPSFKHLIHYRLKQDRVVVFAIFHSSRDLNILRRRLS